MTNTTQDPELTPRDREMMRKGYARRMVELGSERGVADSIAALVIPEPPAYTYSEPVPDPSLPNLPDIRRSDGRWGYWDHGEWRTTHLTDERVCALAACVPLSDAECDALIVSHWPDVTQRRDRVRAAFVRVMRGEVAHG